MTARKKFKVGMAVMISHAGYKHLRWSLAGEQPTPIVTGEVRGFGRGHESLVVIRRHGRKTNETYHMDFWERRYA